MTGDIGRTVTMPYETWKAIEQQVETLSQDRIEWNAEIKRLAATLRDIRDPTVIGVGRNLSQHELQRELDRVQDAARAALDRHTKGASPPPSDPNLVRYYDQHSSDRHTKADT